MNMNTNQNDYQQGYQDGINAAAKTCETTVRQFESGLPNAKRTLRHLAGANVAAKMCIVNVRELKANQKEGAQ